LWEWAVLVEQALYFAIGFLAAALAAVASAPLLSRRAMRLAVSRARLGAPVTEKQALADGDALRAQHAVKQRRIERKLTLAEEAATGLRVDVGRQAAEIIRLRSDIADLDNELYDRRAESERVASRSRELEAAIGATQIALYNADVQRDRALAAQNAAEARAAELDIEASRNRARIAVATARSEYVEGRLEDLTRAMEAARREAEARAAELENVSGRAAALEERLAEATAESRKLSDRLARAAAERRNLANRAAELEERLRLSERAREDTLLENGRQLAELADRGAALAAARAKAVGLEARLASSAAESHARESASSLRMETLAAAQAAAEGSLKAARAEREALQREIESLRNRIVAPTEAPPADAQLRESIDRLGREVVRLFSAQNAPDGQDVSTTAHKLRGLREVETALASPDGDPRNLGDGARRRARRVRAPDR